MLLSRVPVVAYVTLLLTSVAAVLALAVSVPDYLSSVDVIRDMHIEFTQLRVVDDGQAAIGQFRLVNPSPLPLEVGECYFDLHVNRTKVAASNAAAWGADLSLNTGSHDRALAVDRTVSAGHSLALDFTVRFFQDGLGRVRSAAREPDSVFWGIVASCQVRPPYASQQAEVRLSGMRRGDGG